jgi:hypothetical protein
MTREEYEKELKYVVNRNCNGDCNGDCISRQAVLDLVADYDLSMGQVVKGIHSLPSVTPAEKAMEWIPVSERLPKDTRPVIVTWKNADPASYYQYIVGKHFTGTACYKNGKWYWYSSTTEDMLAEYGRYDSEEFDEAIEAVAWMPLPKPYEPKEGVRKNDI